MKIARLKQRTQKIWETINAATGALPGEGFKSAVRKFGDLRKKTTWESAIVSFYAQLQFEGVLDAWSLLSNGLVIPESDELHPYRHRILDAFIAYPSNEDSPGGLDLLKMGLEQCLEMGFFKDVSNFGALLQERNQKNPLAAIALPGGR